MKKVAVLLGSDSDLKRVGGCFKKLDEYGIEYEAHIISAHRTPEAAADFAKNAKENGFGVIIAAAGMAAHLAGAIAARTVLPVIGIPCSGSVSGLDALLSTVQMPPSIPVATVSIDGGKNAAVLAAQILALEDKELYKKLTLERQSLSEEVAMKDAALGEKIAQL